MDSQLREELNKLAPENHRDHRDGAVFCPWTQSREPIAPNYREWPICSGCQRPVDVDAISPKPEPQRLSDSIEEGALYQVTKVPSFEYLTEGETYRADSVSRVYVSLHRPTDGAGTIIRRSAIDEGYVALHRVMSQPQPETVKQLDVFGNVHDTHATEAELNGYHESQAALDLDAAARPHQPRYH